jgi:regulator of protease activity HflC (stomatin/prohibitin superfamily)
MAQITSYPTLRQFRSDASAHVQLFRSGHRVRSGRGLAFWFRPDGASISEIPMADRQLPFVLKGQSADFQELSVQGIVTWRVADPEVLGDRVDFTLDLRTGLHIGEPMDQVNTLLVSLIGQFTNAQLARFGVRDLLDAGVAPLQAVVAEGLVADTSLADIGLALVGIRIASLQPSSELARALQAPTFESLQQQADEAIFARRALAVEKERAIAENELNNQIELAARQKDLIARETANDQARAEGQAEAIKVHAEAEAGRIRTVDQAAADMEQARMSVYRELPPAVLMGLAARDFAGKLERIDNLSITPDMLSSLLGQMRGALSHAPAE